MTASAVRALVVEDDRSWQQILSEILSDTGLEVDVADNLDSAALFLKTQPHRLAVVDLCSRRTTTTIMMAYAGRGARTRSELPAHSPDWVCHR